MLLLDPHVRTGKDRGRHADESRQRHEKHVERIDEKLIAQCEQRTAVDHAHRERDRREEGRHAGGDVHRGRVCAMPDEREQRGADDRQRQDEEDLNHCLSISRSA